MHDPLSFGDWLKRKRKGLDLTRQGLADRVGCSAETIRKLEAEERRPSAQMAERLAEILSVPPHERDTFLRFARGDWQLQPAGSPADLPWPAGVPAAPPPARIPAPSTSFVGRGTELGQLQDALRGGEARLVTLLGPPGVGKTRLSQEVARAAAADFPDGVFFIPLAPLQDPALIGATMIQALGLVEKAGQSPRDLLAEAIRDRRLLLVLDNCEHLIDGVAPLTRDLLDACPHVTIVATSRESLRIPGEWLVPIAPLAAPREHVIIHMDAVADYPALRLFADRARAVRADFTLDETNLQAVAAICAQLDGLPLAIELIATRLRAMSPQELLARMTDQFTLSADGMRAVPARQKTLFNAIGWSYDALPPPEQRLFAYLGVFAGGFTIATAESVLDPLFAGQSVSDLVMALLDKSLLQRLPDDTGLVRFTMLVTIRQVALIALRRLAGEAEARQAHLTHFLDLAEQGAQHLRGPAQREWGDRLDVERDNFRAALEWSVESRQTELALRLLCALGWPWEVRGHYREARLWLARIRALPDAGHYPLLLTRVLNHISRHSWTQDDPAGARALLEESRALALRCGAEGELSLAESLNWLGLVVMQVDANPEQARDLFSQALALNRQWAAEWATALSTFHLGIAAGELGQPVEAQALLEESLALFRRHGDLFFIARVSLFLGHLHLKQGHYDRARVYFEDHLRLDSELQFWDGIVEGWRDLGYLAWQEGDIAQAGRFFDESTAVCRAHGLQKPDIFYFAGLLALLREEYAAARQHFYGCLDMVQPGAEPPLAAACLLGLAAVASETGRPEEAARLSGAAQALRLPAETAVIAGDRAEFERHLRIARDQLGEEGFAARQIAGRTLSAGEALAYARGLAMPQTGRAP